MNVYIPFPRSLSGSHYWTSQALVALYSLRQRCEREPERNLLGVGSCL